MQDQELKAVIAQSIDELNEKERLIVSLYYYEELKLKEIAAILGITTSRVSQIHTKALIKMKKKLSDYINE
jgi:RNA polymerase sigma factor for flagellar operon FliA